MDVIEFMNICALAYLLLFFGQFEFFNGVAVYALLCGCVWDGLDHLSDELLPLEGLRCGNGHFLYFYVVTH